MIIELTQYSTNRTNNGTEYIAQLRNNDDSSGRGRSASKDLLQSATRDDMGREGENSNIELYRFQSARSRGRLTKPKRHFGGATPNLHAISNIGNVRHLNDLHHLSKLPSVDQSFRLHSLKQPNLLQHTTPDNWTAYINQFDCAALLDTLTVTHGIKLSDYRVVKNKRGNQRIVVNMNQRKLSASDFLIQHLHLSWPESKAMILSDHFVDRGIAYANRDMWSKFRLYEYENPPFQSVVNSAKAEKKAIYETYQFTYNHSKSYFDNQLQKRLTKNRRSIALTEVDKNTRSVQDKQEKGMNQRYLTFLSDEVKSGNKVALEELRRITPYTRSEEQSVSALLLLKGKEQAAYIGVEYDYDVHSNGDIHYTHKGNKVISDTHDEILIFERSQETIEMALHIARGRFGYHLEVVGATHDDGKIIHQILNETGKSNVVVDVKNHSIERG